VLELLRCSLSRVVESMFSSEVNFESWPMQIGLTKGDSVYYGRFEGLRWKLRLYIIEEVIWQ